MRLFIGLPLSDAAREDTASLSSLAQQQIFGRYVLPSNYHLTLAFLGEVGEQKLISAKSALNAFAAQFSAPMLTLGSLSYFSRPSNAILIRQAESEDDLSAMRAALLDILSEYALPFTEGPFSPHVTLARHANVEEVPLNALSSSCVRFLAPAAVLYLSARDEHGVLRYTPLHSALFHSFS